MLRNDRRRRWRCLAILAATVITGLLWRRAPLHLPWLLYKYGGSMLWAAAVYWLVAAALPGHRFLRLSLVAGLIALAVELSRLVPGPGLDAFRLTLAGQLLLGRYFSVLNIAAYWIAIAVAGMIDNALRRT